MSHLQSETTGDSTALQIDPSADDAYWRSHFQECAYVTRGASYDGCWGPAYRYGRDCHHSNAGRDFDTIESELGKRWPQHRGNSSLEWADARHAARDAWRRLAAMTPR